MQNENAVRQLLVPNPNTLTSLFFRLQEPVSSPQKMFVKIIAMVTPELEPRIDIILPACMLARPTEAHVLVGALPVMAFRSKDARDFLTTVGVLNGISRFSTPGSELENAVADFLARMVFYSAQVESPADAPPFLKKDEGEQMLGLSVLAYVRAVPTSKTRRDALASVFEKVNKRMKEGMVPAEKVGCFTRRIPNGFGRQLFEHLTHKTMSAFPFDECATHLARALKGWEE